MQIYPLSSSLNFWAKILHAKFSFRMYGGHFTIRCLLSKVHWTFKTVLWLIQRSFCVQEFLRVHEIQLSTDERPSTIYFTTCKTRIYYRPFLQSYFSKISLFVMTRKTTCNELVFFLPIIMSFLRKKGRNQLYVCIPFQHVPYNDQSLIFSLELPRSRS